MTTEHEVEMNNQDRLAKEATEAGFPCGGWMQDIRPGFEVFFPDVIGEGEYRNVTGTAVRVNPGGDLAFSFVLRLEDGMQIVYYNHPDWPCYFREPVMSPLLQFLVSWAERVSQNAPVKDETFKKNEVDEDVIIKQYDPDSIHVEVDETTGQKYFVDPYRMVRASADEELDIKQFDHGGVIEHVDPELERLLDEEELIEEGQVEELRRALASEGVDRRKNILEHQMPDVD